jgi:hypothetical protein
MWEVEFSQEASNYAIDSHPYNVKTNRRAAYILRHEYAAILDREIASGQFITLNARVVDRTGKG